MSRFLSISPRRIISGQGVEFDGAQNHITLGTLGTLGSNLGSGFYCRFQIQTTQTAACYIGNNRVGNMMVRIGFNLERNLSTSNGEIVFHAVDNSNNILIVSTQSSCSFNDGNLHTIEITANFATKAVAIIVDGVSKAVWAANNSVLSNFGDFSRAFYIGALNNNGTAASFLSGSIFNFQIGTSSSNLYGSYNLTEGTGTTATDSSGSNNNGTFAGTPVPRWLKRTSATRGAVTRNPTSPIYRVNPIAVCQNNIYSLTTQQQNALFTLMQAVGVKRIRSDFIMSSIQPTQGNFVHTEWEAMVDLAATYGIEFIAVLEQYGMPAWASPSGAMYAPTPAVYQAWCEEMASHYEGKISLFELGNEPNFNIFWPAGPNAADYVALLSAGYTGIKAGNADAQVISAAPGNKFATDEAGIQTFTYFTDMYAAGLKSCSDIIALHPYADAVYDGTTTNNFSRLNTMRNIMISNGDLNKRVILSELGWSTYTGGVTEAQQAANIKTFYNSIMFGDYKYIDIISFYNFQNAGTDAANTEHNYGLVTNDFTPKPAYASYTEMKNQYNGVFTESAL